MSLRSHHLPIFLVLVGLCFFGACSASEETASSELERSRAELPTSQPQVSLPPDTALAGQRQQEAAQFTSKQDTLTASIVQRSRTSAPPSRESERTPEIGYTIQIGAFSDATNALRLMKKTKERLGDQPVLNRFEPADKLYRVSVGLFSSREEALAFRQSMIQRYGQDYRDSWIVQTQK